MTIEAGITKSTKRNRYCDFSGFVARYQHPNGVRYNDIN